MRISFGGIYDIKCSPYMSKNDFDKTCNDFSGYVAQKPYAKVISMFPIERNSDKRIRVVSSVDNPHLLIDLFAGFNENLASEYLNKSVMELHLDTVA